MPRRRKAGTRETQSILFEPDTEWKMPRMADLPPSWERFRQVGLDIETCCPDLKTLGPAVRRNGFIAGVSFATMTDRIEAWYLPDRIEAWYLPVAHALGPNLSRDAVMQYLRDQAKTFRGEIVGANLQYDIDYLAQYGIVFKQATFRDVQVADALLCELHDRYSLQAIAERRGFGGKTTELLDQALEDYRLTGKGDMWKLPAKFVGPYAEDDARLPLKIMEQQMAEIKSQDLQKVFDLESKVLPVCVKMRRRGVRIDFDHLAVIERRMLGIEQTQAGHISELTGKRFGIEDIGKAAVIGPLLEEEGFRLPRTKTNKYNVDKAILAKINTPLSNAISKMKRANKIRSTFVTSIRKHAVEGRIHCTFTQLRKQREDGDVVGAAFGRLSSSQPNLQQQPIRDAFAEDWRCIYLPDEGGEWCCNDYSEQEPRALLHWASQTARAVLPKGHKTREVVARAVKQYHDDPDTDGHQMLADMLGWVGEKGRKNAKTILLGLCYGMGGVKLCAGLGLPTKLIRGWNNQLKEVAGEEAMDLMEKFNERLPYVKWMAQVAEHRVKENSFLRTLSGRRCRFPKDQYGNVDWTHKSLNRLIQGSAADQTKMAMVMADDAGIKLQLQVHDELDLTIYDRSEGHELAHIMREAIPLNVPTKVDVEVGPNWGDIQKIKAVAV